MARRLYRADYGRRVDPDPDGQNQTTQPTPLLLRIAFRGRLGRRPQTSVRRQTRCSRAILVHLFTLAEILRPGTLGSSPHSTVLRMGHLARALLLSHASGQVRLEIASDNLLESVVRREKSRRHTVPHGIHEESRDAGIRGIDDRGSCQEMRARLVSRMRAL